MKTGLVLGGVGLLLAAVYFIARGKALPNVSGKQAAGGAPKPSPNQNLASSLLTSQNIAALGGLVGAIGGTPAKPAGPAGANGSGLNIVTDYSQIGAAAASPQGSNGEIIVDLSDEG